MSAQLSHVFRSHRPTVTYEQNTNTSSVKMATDIWTLHCMTSRLYQWRSLFSSESCTIIELSFAFWGLVLGGFANSWGGPENKNTSHGPSMDWGIKTVWQLEQVFERYRMVFKSADGLRAEFKPREEWGMTVHARSRCSNNWDIGF